MSRHILYTLFPFIKSLISSGNSNVVNLLGTSIIFTYAHGTFSLGTNKTEEICITKKYKYVVNGFTNFMIVDNKGRHFNVNNSFWYWKWDSIEDWTNIQLSNEKNNKIFVSYYGYRIPFLGMFPNIIDFPPNLDINSKEKKIDIMKHIHV